MKNKSIFILIVLLPFMARASSIIFNNIEEISYKTDLLTPYKIVAKNKILKHSKKNQKLNYLKRREIIRNNNYYNDGEFFLPKIKPFKFKKLYKVDNKIYLENIKYDDGVYIHYAKSAISHNGKIQLKKVRIYKDSTQIGTKIRYNLSTN
jgi:hypothetical protein